jgi:predicted nucleic acid-binding protein
MVEYVADTHALIWYLSGSERLGDEARALFDSAIAGEIRVLIPAIVVDYVCREAQDD